LPNDLSINRRRVKEPRRTLERDAGLPRWARAVSAYAIAAVAMVWTIERVSAFL